MAYSAVNSKGRKQFYEKIREYFGTPKDFKFNDLLFVSTKNKYFLMDTKFTDTIEIDFNTKVLGLYIAEINEYGEIRLSIEGSQKIGPHATKHLVELTDEQVELVMRGQDLDFEKEIEEQKLNNQYYILYTDRDGNRDFLGCGKIKNGRLLNFLPKNRRIRD